MQENIELRVSPREAAEVSCLRRVVAQRCNVDEARVDHIAVVRRSVDARQRKVMVNLSVKVYIDEIPASLSLVNPVDYKPVTPCAPQVVIAGNSGYSSTSVL